MHVVATAGHVDHGKSTLVKALTGTDPDRLEEEKARGLTIDLGFAGTRLPSRRGISFIDVPGHVRFLKNMLAGVGGVDAVMFVVDATEGWKPQSEEHLRILELLGIRHGLIVLTKVGQADDELIELAGLDIADCVSGTFLEQAPVIAVDAVEGIGLDDLKAGLDKMCERAPRSVDLRRPRLWIDRAFAARGAGTVVTGTLAGGAIRADDQLTLLPQGRDVRVRALQSQHAIRTKIGPGNRVAANLSGVGHDSVARGQVLVRSEQWHATDRFDASLDVLDSLAHPVTRRGAYLAYVGSGEFPVRLRVLGPDAIAAGSAGFVRLHLPVKLPLVLGDRFILRESGQQVTIGGGEVLDVDPVLAAAKAAPDRSVERIVAERRRVDVGLLERLTGHRHAPDVGHWAVAPDELERVTAKIRSGLAEAGPLGLSLAVLDDFERAVVKSLADLEIAGGQVRKAGASDAVAGHDGLVARLAAQPFAPPEPEGVDRQELRELVRRGELISEDGIYFAASALQQAAKVVAELLAERPDGITVAEARDAWGTTRKFAIPLMNRLDAGGVTRRRGDLRIAGPRLPAL